MARDHHGGDEDDEQEVRKRFDEFDCPDCDANNPWDDGFTDGSEVRCFYCGTEWLAVISDSGKLKFQPT